jgi:hypothetical protein
MSKSYEKKVDTKWTQEDKKNPETLYIKCFGIIEVTSTGFKPVTF